MKNVVPAWAIRTEADRAAIAAGCYWDAAEAERIIEFAEAYISPRFTVGDFQLFDWQRRFLMSLYGWRNREGLRRFRRAVLHVPKKNGKTLLVSVLAAYELYAARVGSPLVCSASTTRENAKQVFDQLKAAINREAKLTAISKLTESAKTIKVPHRDGEYRALSADAPNAEGLNCSAVIVDEAHAHQNERLYRTLEYAMIGRADGLMVIISTAGDDLAHWYYALVQRGKNIVAGTDLDPTTYAEIYEADPDKDNLEDPAVWNRVNPSLDEYPGFTSERFRQDLEAAKKSTGDWLSFQRYRLNIFRRAQDEVWIDLASWDRLKAPRVLADLVGYPCWLGFDGSQTTDPSSLSACWLLPDANFYAASWAWVAEEGVRRREAGNLPQYRQFAHEGAMTITKGNVIDRRPIRTKILELRAQRHDIRAIVLDPNGAIVFGTELASEGFTVHRQPQNYKHFSEPCKEFQAAVLAGKIGHDGGGWLRWTLNSVRLEADEYKQVRPVKTKSRDHIDGAISLLMAFGQAYQQAGDVKPKRSVYEDRGLLIL